jgi:hypothetical protein
MPPLLSKRLLPKAGALAVMALHDALKEIRKMRESQRWLIQPELKRP